MGKELFFSLQKLQDIKIFSLSYIGFKGNGGIKRKGMIEDTINTIFLYLAFLYNCITFMLLNIGILCLSYL